MRIQSLVAHPTRLLAGLVLLVAATGCGSSEGESSDTGATSTTTTQTAAEAEVSLPAPGEPWDVLFLASKFEVATEYVLSQYEELAEEFLGVDVRVKGLTTESTKAWSILQQVRNLGFPGMAEEVAEAEIIVVIAYPQGSDEGAPTQIDEARDVCKRPGNTKPMDSDVVAGEEFWEPYRLLLDQIYTEIWRLRDGTPTVLIAGEVSEGYLPTQRDVGIEEECRAWFEAWSNASRQAAEAHGARWVSLYDLLNGPGHDIDPFEMGWTGPTELQPTLGTRKLNDVGSALVADALAAAGFTPAEAP